MVLDSSCALHYQVSVVGLNGDEARVPDGTVDHIFAEIGDINGDQFIVRHVLNEVQRNLVNNLQLGFYKSVFHHLVFCSLPEVCYTYLLGQANRSWTTDGF